MSHYRLHLFNREMMSYSRQCLLSLHQRKRKLRRLEKARMSSESSRHDAMSLPINWHSNKSEGIK